MCIRDRLLDLIYPVGSIYMSVNNVAPSVFLGGTWTAWGAGKVPVGINTSDADFSTVEKTGGAKTHTLTTAQLPGHYHTVGAHSHGLNSHTHSIPALSGKAASNGAHTHQPSNQVNFMTTNAGSVVDDTGSAISGSGYNFPRIETDYSFTKAANTTSNGAHEHTVTTTASTTGAASGSTANSSAFNSGSTGSGSAHNNLQPYITCYMWKRTA